MELRHLRYFVTLASELHFGRAAARLHITQPPLSVGLRQLEDELGFRLFERDSKHVALTAAGQAYLATAQELLAHAEKARDYGAALAQGKAGHLDIGFSSAMVFRGLAEILSEFEATHPHVQFSLREGPSLEQKRLVQEGRLDAGFLNVGDVGELGRLAVFHEPYVACLPGNHPLAQRRVIDMQMLRNERFVMFSRRVSPGHYDHLIALCASAGFQPQSRLEVQQFLTIAALVAAGMGVAVVPASVGQSKMPNACFVKIRNEQPQPTAYLVWDKQRKTPGLAAFVDAVRRVIAARGSTA